MQYWDMIERFDAYLDGNVSDEYKEQPLAQDWARVAKVAEELGEAIAELIAITGQNPRKGYAELADVANTAILAIQHFTKNQEHTSIILHEKMKYCCERVGIDNGFCCVTLEKTGSCTCNPYLAVPFSYLRNFR